MTDKEKILQFLDYKGISKNKFYTTTGFSTGFLDSGNSLGVDKLRIIIDKYPDFNPEWLLTGKGEMLRSECDSSAVSGSKFEKRPYINYNRLPAVVTVESNEEEENILAVPAKLAAGYVGGGFMDASFVEALPTFRLPYLRNGTFRCFEVQGCSMEEGIKDGDYFVGKFIDNIRNFGEGRIHALIIPELDSLLLKRVFRHPKDQNVIILRSDNNNTSNIYPDIYVDIRYISEIWSFTAVISFNQPSFDMNNFKEILATKPDAVYYLEEK